MTSFVKFTPISGSHNLDPPCYLLEVDQTKILLDCGSDEDFSNVDSICSKLKRLTKTIDCILISHGDIYHCGALAYVYAKMGLHCPVYTAIPVDSLAPLSIMEALISKQNDGPFDLFGVSDVDLLREKIERVSFQQSAILGGHAKGISLMAYRAGHSLGGAIWRIRKDTDDIVYAIDISHKKEKHLNGAALENIRKPSLLITDSRQALTPQLSRKQRDNDFIDAVMSTLKREGNVLIPIDSCTRLYEVAFVLDQHWQQNRLSTYPLLFVSHQADETFKYAMSNLERMSDAVTKAFDQTRENPFEFKFLKKCHRLDQVRQYGSPKVVLATNIGMQSGFSRDLFIEWAFDKLNTVIVLSREQKSLTSRLGETQGNVDVCFQRQERLYGEELRAYLREEQEKIKREEAEETYRRQREEDSESDVDEDEEQERKKQSLMQIEQERYWTLTQFDLFLNDSSGFFKQSHQCFPVFEKRIKFDDYGEIIKPEEYMKMEVEDQPIKEEKEKEEENEKVPKKWVPVDLNIPLNCTVRVIDMEGLTDGRSIKNILSTIAPRKLIVVHGDEDSTQHLTQYAKFSAEIVGEALSPKVMEVVNVSASTNIIQLKLTDSLLSSLGFVSLGRYELSYFSGLVRTLEDEQLKDEDDAPLVPVLDVAVDSSKEIRHPVFIGDIKLSEFRKECTKVGIDTRFCSRDANDPSSIFLVCDNCVIVQKNDIGGLVMEGVLCDSYYKVRNLLYKQHAIV